ncbi:mRNA-capping enzyme [Capsella rubella]|uniref:mRNA-capping enzyme n=1 Tax=Capsella rubella TaxID=81985 RepID=UPI000CD4B8F6|nr:mRNA-capping enzyme [Capsella rubella]
MDLNASPLPEEDDDHPLNKRCLEDRIESAVEIARREREERRKRMRFDRPTRISQPVYRDQSYQKRDTRVYDQSKIPQGWLDCPGFGQEIGCIIPSKVPLSESYNEHVPPGKRYSFKQVVRNQRISGRKLGLVIDLTNTTRYYPTLELKKDGIKHVKIACRGRDAVPDNVSVNNFVNEVIHFILNQKHTKKYILVHCTHGHNRTGFMIVHYLMRSTPTMNVTQALKMFSDARPPGIYKPDYIDALYTFYHEIKPESVTCPPTPEWKKSAEIDLNGEAVQDDDDDDDEAPSGRVQVSVENVKMSNDDVLGDEIPHGQEEAYRRFCNKILYPNKKHTTNIGGRGCTRFPGSHPVSLDRESLQLLRQRYYYATWKADGTRYMMLLTIDGCYLIDRSFKFRRVQMRFPCKHSREEISEKVHHYTLLDGEMVIDTPKDEEGQARRRYLVYDLVAINGESVVERTFCERWNMLVKEVIAPRDAERGTSRNCYRYDLEPFGVRMKGFWLLSTVEKLLKVTIPSLSHESDGLIFQGWDDPYTPLTDKGLLKWKYAEMNSVDFLFEMDENDGRRMLFLHEKGKKKLMEGYSVEFGDEDLNPATYSGKILECRWDQKKQVWVYMRIRVDKPTPNDIVIAHKVIKCITDNITEQVLLQEIREIIRLPMYADRIKIDSRAAAARRR